MDSPVEVDPFQDQLNQVVVAVALLMARAMDFEFQYLVHQVGTERHHVRKAADAANRIVVLCRRLIDDVRSYERYDRWRREEDAELQNREREDDEIDF
jgi:hypothetical protein